MLLNITDSCFTLYLNGPTFLQDNYNLAAKVLC